MSDITSYSHGISAESEFGYSQAIQVGETIYVSGQVSVDGDGNFVGANDIDVQLRTVWANIDKVLDHFGVTRNQVVQDNVYVVDLAENVAAVSASHLAYFGDHRPTSTTVGVSAFFFPGQLVEISVIVRTDLPA